MKLLDDPALKSKLNVEEQAVSPRLWFNFGLTRVIVMPRPCTFNSRTSF